MAVDYNTLFGDMSKCPICGKEFIPAPQHIYKMKTNGGYTKLLCSYHCMRAYEEKVEKERQKKKKG